MEKYQFTWKLPVASHFSGFTLNISWRFSLSWNWKTIQKNMNPWITRSLQNKTLKIESTKSKEKPRLPFPSFSSKKLCLGAPFFSLISFFLFIFFIWLFKGFGGKISVGPFVWYVACLDRPLLCPVTFASLSALEHKHVRTCFSSKQLHFSSLNPQFCSSTYKH